MTEPFFFLSFELFHLVQIGPYWDVHSKNPLPSGYNSHARGWTPVLIHLSRNMTRMQYVFMCCLNPDAPDVERFFCLTLVSRNPDDLHPENNIHIYIYSCLYVLNTKPWSPNIPVSLEHSLMIGRTVDIQPTQNVNILLATNRLERVICISAVS